MFQAPRVTKSLVRPGQKSSRILLCLGRRAIAEQAIEAVEALVIVPLAEETDLVANLPKNAGSPAGVMKPPISPADPPALLLEPMKPKFWTICLGAGSVARLLRPSQPGSTSNVSVFSNNA